jgi:hypothetical protein
MGPWDLNKKQAKYLAIEWLNDDGPLYVDVYIPHSASSGTPYLISKLEQLIKLFDDAAPGSVITIIKGIFAFEGDFDEQMRASFRDQFSNGEHWWVLEGTYYPDEAEILASGSSWPKIESEMLEEPERLYNVLIGKEPDIPDYWIENHDENLIILIKQG